MCSNSFQEQIGNLQVPMKADITSLEMFPRLTENTFISLGDSHASYDLFTSQE